jgi:hypothetical protein
MVMMFSLPDHAEELCILLVTMYHKLNFWPLGSECIFQYVLFNEKQNFIAYFSSTVKLMLSFPVEETSRAVKEEKAGQALVV